MKNNIKLTLGVIIIVISNCWCIKAQPVFKSLTYGDGGTGKCKYEIFYNQHSRNYISLVADKEVGPSILSFDSIGNVISKLTYSNGLSGVQNSFIRSKNNYFILNYTEYRPGDVEHLIAKIDTNGSFIWKKAYDIGLTGNYNLTELNNSGFGLNGGYWTGTAGRPFYMLVDSNGNVLNNRMFDSMIGNVIFASQLSNGDIMAGINNDFNDGAIISKLDSSGTILWSKNYFRHGIFLSLVKNSDESLTICGLVRSIAPVDPQIFVMKIDTGGNVLWTKSYGGGSTNLSINQSQQFRIRSTTDGGYIMTGTGLPYYNINRLLDVVLLKLDSSGNLQWSRWHGGINTYDYGMDVSQTPDGGYIVLGNTSASYPSIGYYIFKTDSLGFTGCQEYSDTIAFGNYSVHDSTIVLTAVPQNIVVTGSNLRDTLLAPPLTYDGCLLNPVKEKFHIDKTQNVFPNPTTGKVNIQSSEPFKKGNTITVYDSMGKVILQKNYANEKDGQLDLSRYGKGIYLVRITEGEKVSESKVVVE